MINTQTEYGYERQNMETQYYGRHKMEASTTVYQGICDSSTGGIGTPVIFHSVLFDYSEVVQLSTG